MKFDTRSVAGYAEQGKKVESAQLARLGIGGRSSMLGFIITATAP